jgi:hypothetical protein
MNLQTDAVAWAARSISRVALLFLECRGGGHNMHDDPIPHLLAHYGGMQIFFGTGELQGDEFDPSLFQPPQQYV